MHINPPKAAMGITLITVFCAATAVAAPDQSARFPIAVAEVEAKAQARFERIDTDNNGVIEAAEFEAAKPAGNAAGKRAGAKKHPGMHQGKHRAAQRGGGGFGPGRAGPGKEVRDAAEAELFAILDSNEDGSISSEEFSQNSHQNKALAMKRAVFKHHDANKDNVLSAAEMPYPGKHIRAADTDGDGQVTQAEMRAHRKSMRQQRQAKNSG